MKVKVKHTKLDAEEALEMRIQMDMKLFDHLIEGHDHTPREACEVVLREALKYRY